MDEPEMNLRLIRLSEAVEAQFADADPATLPPAVQVFWVIWQLEAEVNNGGFLQYFGNSSGRLVPHAVAALRTIGANTMADIVERAIFVAGRDIAWADDEARSTALNALGPDVPEELDFLDRAFFTYPDNLTVLLYTYASEHSDELGEL